MTIGELRATSPGVGESGPVAVTATRGPHGFSAVEVQAFGRVTKLTADQLAQLHGQFVNGMQLSYEGGYKELGGRTVYIELLSQDVISGAQESQRISVNEQGAARVAPPSRGSH